MDKKKQTSKREQSKSFINQKKVFGSNTLQLSEDDASRLVGSIVEKGISEKPLINPTLNPFPKPTVLPFPVARHRSHGPVSPLLLFTYLFIYFNSFWYHFGNESWF